MSKITDLEKKGYKKSRSFKTEPQAKEYAKRIKISGKDAQVVPNGTNFLVMAGVAKNATPTGILIAEFPSGLTWNEFVGKNLSAYKHTMSHKEAMQRLSEEWKDYKALQA